MKHELSAVSRCVSIGPAAYSSRSRSTGGADPNHILNQPNLVGAHSTIEW